MGSSDFSLVEQIEGDIDVLVLRGRLDPEACDEVMAVAGAKLEAGVKGLAVVLTELAQITSCGIGSLIWMYAECQKTGCRFFVVNSNPHIERVLSLTGLDMHFPLFKTFKEASASP